MIILIRAKTIRRLSDRRKKKIMESFSVQYLSCNVSLAVGDSALKDKFTFSSVS